MRSSLLHFSRHLRQHPVSPQPVSELSSVFSLELSPGHCCFAGRGLLQDTSHVTFSCYVLSAISEPVTVLQFSVLLGHGDSFKEHWPGFTSFSLNLSNGVHRIKWKCEAEGTCAEPTRFSSRRVAGTAPPELLRPGV